MSTQAIANPADSIDVEVTVHGRTLLPDTEVSIRGERGRFRYISASRSSTGAVSLTFVGGPAGHESFRSFRPERIRTVHRIPTTRHNTAH